MYKCINVIIKSHAECSFITELERKHKKCLVVDNQGTPLYRSEIDFRDWLPVVQV